MFLLQLCYPCWALSFWETLLQITRFLSKSTVPFSFLVVSGITSMLIFLSFISLVISWSFSVILPLIFHCKEFRNPFSFTFSFARVIFVKSILPKSIAYRYDSLSNTIRIRLRRSSYFIVIMLRKV